VRTEVPTSEPDTRREDDDARQQRWDEFFAEVRRLYRYGDGFVLRVLADLVDGEFNGVDTVDEAAAELLRNFAETEGWSGVLSALAQIQRESERFQRECFDRR
jgi:hypothetical protein